MHMLVNVASFIALTVLWGVVPF